MPFLENSGQYPEQVRFLERMESSFFAALNIHNQESAFVEIRN